MAPRVDPVRSDEALPARADVVIIGGGIIGASTALFLAEKGVSVALCEKGHIAGEQSSRNWGWCRKMGRDPRELPLIIESLRLWQGMNQRVEAETGFRQLRHHVSGREPRPNSASSNPGSIMPGNTSSTPGC